MENGMTLSDIAAVTDKNEWAKADGCGLSSSSYLCSAMADSGAIVELQNSLSQSQVFVAQ